MSTKIKSVAGKTAPWREGAPWWLALVESLIALGLGAYILMQTASAAANLLTIMGVFLLVVGLMAIFSAVRNRVPPSGKTPELIRGAVAAVVGVIVLLSNYFSTEIPPYMSIVVALALIVFGLFGLYTAFRISGKVGLQWGRVLAGLVYTVLGGMLFLANAEEAQQIVQMIGVLFAVVGIALLIYTIILFRKRSQESEIEMAQAAVDGHKDNGE